MFKNKIILQSILFFLFLKVNTFQAVIAYDETDSYVLFLYPEDGLNFFGTRPKVFILLSPGQIRVEFCCCSWFLFLYLSFFLGVV